MTTARQDALTASLRTAMTKAERRSAVKSALQTPEARDERAQLNREVSAFLLNQHEETRLAPFAEGTNSQGGYLAPPGFAGEVIRLLKEYDGIIADCEDLPTEHGMSWKRPQVGSLTASGAALAEGGQVQDGTSLFSLPGQQSFGITPTYSALLYSSLQLIQDAIHQDLSDGNAGGWSPLRPTGPQSDGIRPPVYDGVPTDGDFVGLLASAASEAIGRQVASAGSTAIYAAATAGQEASLGTLTSANLAKLIALVDPAYLGNAKFYMNASDFATVFGAATGILANSDSHHLFGFPVVITNAATTWVSASVTGPVFGNLGRFMSLRRVRDGINVQVLRERYADYLQVALNVYGRFDFGTRGETTALAFSK